MRLKRMQAVMRDDNMQAALVALGWMGRSIVEMAQNRSWVTSIGEGCDVFPTQGYPRFSMHATPLDYLSQAKLVVQGEGRKDFVQATADGTNATVINLTRRSTGVRIKISDSAINFRNGTFDITLGDAAVALGQVFLKANRPSVEIVMLGISNTGGQASILGIATPRVTVANSGSTPSTTLISAETINMYDLGALTADEATAQPSLIA